MKFCQIRYEGNLLAKMLLNCLNKNVYFSVQAAYIRKLQQQADSIKKLLKLLNSAGGSSADQDGGSSNDDISRPAHPAEEEGYEQLWELGTNCNGEIPLYRFKYLLNVLVPYLKRVVICVAEPAQALPVLFPLFWLHSGPVLFFL